MPKLFRHSGKIRNKHISKRDTEKLVKEIWRERLEDPGGRCDASRSMRVWLGGGLPRVSGRDGWL